MARAQSDEGVFLRVGGLELVVALEVALVDDFDSVLLSSGAMGDMQNLLVTFVRFEKKKRGGKKRETDGRVGSFTQDLAEFKVFRAEATVGGAAARL